MRSLLLVLFAALALANSAPPSALAADFNGSVLVSCDQATVANATTPPNGLAVDAIVQFGVAPSAHPHAFFGSTEASATMTLPKMLAGGTSCDIKSDHAAYWIPSIIAADGSTVVPTRSSFYYRAVNRGVPIHPFPSGWRGVWGNSANTSRYSSAATWQCAGAPPGRTIPTSCPNGGGVQMTMDFGPCWDGLDLGTGGGGHDTAAPRANLAGAPTGADGKPHCPASHPVNVPALAFIVNWPARALGGRLSSDAPGADPGASIHGDFFNGWTFNSQNEDALSLLVDKCLNVPDNIPSTTCISIGGSIYQWRNGVRGAYVTD